MSNIEHALENAIDAVESNVKFEDWRDNDPNLKHVKASPEEIWSMANYVVYSYEGIYHYD